MKERKSKVVKTPSAKSNTFLSPRLEAKQGRTIGRNGCEKHASGKREGLVKTLPFPYHCIVVVEKRNVCSRISNVVTMYYICNRSYVSRL